MNSLTILAQSKQALAGPDAALDPVVSEGVTAKWLGVGASTLQRWRRQAYGPAFVRLSERRIGYRVSEVERWLKSCERQSASQDAA